MWEDDLGIQQVKGITEKVVKSLVAQAAVSNFLLEYHIKVNPSKLVGIQSQLAIHEVTVRLMEPTDYKTTTVEAAA